MAVFSISIVLGSRSVSHGGSDEARALSGIVSVSISQPFIKVMQVLNRMLATATISRHLGTSLAAVSLLLFRQVSSPLRHSNTIATSIEMPRVPPVADCHKTSKAL